MPAIPPHHTATSDTAWDGPAAKANLNNDGTQAYYESAYAWRGDDDPTTKADYKFIHHDVDSDGKVGAANVKACQSAIGVLNGGMGGTKIPDADKKGVHAHLAAHLKDAGVDVPDLKGNPKTPSSQKSIPMEFKVADDGTFEGKLAVYGNVDLGKDMIEPGAFKKTMAEKGTTVPLLWQHDPDQPIGDLQLRDASDALYVKGRLLTDDIPQARTAYALIKAGVIKGLSIGYDTVKDSIEGGVRHLKELRLWEGSIVTFPMNEMATITAVKAVTQSQLDNDQKLDAAKTILEQFKMADRADMEVPQTDNDGQSVTLHPTGVKEGRVLSAATKTSLMAAQDHHQKAMGHLKDANDIFDTLLVSGAADDLDEEEDDPEAGTMSAGAVSETKSEPVTDHSAIEQALSQLRDLYRIN